jgi:glyoxylate/hydroxypyruvate reductase
MLLWSGARFIARAVFQRRAFTMASNDAKRKVLVTRNIGQDALGLLRARTDLEVGHETNRHAGCEYSFIIQLVLWDNERRPTRDWVLEHAPGVEGMLVLMSEKVRKAWVRVLLLSRAPQVDDEMLDAAGPQLRVVSTLSVGHDHIDKAALAKRNIVLGNTPDVLTDAVVSTRRGVHAPTTIDAGLTLLQADLTVMLTLMAGRNAGQGQALVLDGKVTQSWYNPE